MEDQEVQRKLRTFSELMGRFKFFSQLGQDSYDGTRDIYQALGYPKDITWSNYWARYNRQDMAKAIIDRPVQASWKGEIDVIENISEDLTPFETAWQDIYER